MEVSGFGFADILSSSDSDAGDEFDNPRHRRRRERSPSPLRVTEIREEIRSRRSRSRSPGYNRNESFDQFRDGSREMNEGRGGDHYRGSYHRQTDERHEYDNDDRYFSRGRGGGSRDYTFDRNRDRRDSSESHEFYNRRSRNDRGGLGDQFSRRNSRGGNNRNNNRRPWNDMDTPRVSIVGGSNNTVADVVPTIGFISPDGSQIPLVGAKSDNLNVSPLTYRQFVLSLPESISPEEAQTLFNEYTNRQRGMTHGRDSGKLAIFNDQKDKDDFRNKYHPKVLSLKRDEIINFCKQAALVFEENMTSGEWFLSLTGNSIDTSNTDNRRMAPSISSTPARIDADLYRSCRLICILDKEKGLTTRDEFIEKLPTKEFEADVNDGNSNINSIEEDLRIKTSRLDRSIIYLRRVHLFCYYCSEEYENEKDMEVKCGQCHMRSPISDHASAVALNDQKLWIEKLDSKIASRLSNGWRLDVMTGSLTIPRLLDEWMKKQMVKKAEDKFGCKFSDCGKVFKGKDFLVKHVNTKHSDAVYQARAEIENDLYYMNYLSDAAVTAANQHSAFSSQRGVSPSAAPHGILPIPVGVVPCNPVNSGRGNFRNSRIRNQSFDSRIPGEIAVVMSRSMSGSTMAAVAATLGGSSLRDDPRARHLKSYDDL